MAHSTSFRGRSNSGFFAFGPLSALAALAAGCSNSAPGAASGTDGGTTDSPAADDGTGGAPATVTDTTFKSSLCAYTVKAPAIDGYPKFEPSASTVGAGDATPKHVRLGLGGNVVAGQLDYADPSTSIAIAWQSDFAAMPSSVRWGSSATSLDQRAEGFSLLMPQEFSEGPPDGLRFHEAHVCGLQPGRTFYYQVGGGAVGVEKWSPVASFTTAPAAGGADPVKFVAAGDSRQLDSGSTYPIWNAILGRAKSAGAPLVLFSGDSVLFGVQEDLWEKFLTASDAYQSGGFVATAIGNHESEAQRYFARTMMPGGGKNPQRFASFDYGPVHVVEFDDEYGIIEVSADTTGYRAELAAWLDADLSAAKANRAKVPWIVTFHHHPLFSSSADRVDERQRIRTAFQATYDKYGVDLDFVGHDHYYERSKPITGDTPHDGATVKNGDGGTRYIVSAGAGAQAYATLSTPPPTSEPGTIALYKPDTGEGLYSLVTADAHTLTLTAYKLTGTSGASPKDDAQVDTVALTR